MTRSEYANRPGRSSKWIAKSRRVAIYLRDGYRCGYCRADLSTCAAHLRSLDHLTPRERGGTDESANLILACLSCNSTRQSTPWHRFATARAVRRIQSVRRRVLDIPRARAILAGKATR